MIFSEDRWPLLGIMHWWTRQIGHCPDPACLYNGHQGSKQREATNQTNSPQEGTMSGSVNYRRAALELVEEFDDLKTSEGVVERLAAGLSVFGFSSMLITGVPEPPQHVEAYFLRNGWPRRWTHRYANENNYAEDPLTSWGRRNINPFEWSTANET